MLSSPRGTAGRQRCTAETRPLERPERVYVIALFTLTWAVIAALLVRPGALPEASGWLATAAFFLAYGLFTISVG